MIETLSFLISGTILGISASLSPGPMLTLVVSETLKHSKIEGIKVAISPLITDIVIVPLTLFVITELAQFETMLAIITLAGSIFIARLGYESLTTKELTVETLKIKSDSLKRGVITNALNPNPYLFWLTVGGPLTVKAYTTNLDTAITFVASFYLFLIGTKILVAVLVDKSKMFISTAIYIWLARLLGVALLIFAVLFLKQAIELWQK